MDKYSRMLVEGRSTIRGRLEEDRTKLQSEISQLKRQLEKKQRLVAEIDELLGDKA